jgi:hypothetical protein
MCPSYQFVLVRIPYLEVFWTRKYLGKEGDNIKHCSIEGCLIPHEISIGNGSI